MCDLRPDWFMTKAELSAFAYKTHMLHVDINTLARTLVWLANILCLSSIAFAPEFTGLSSIVFD